MTEGVSSKNSEKLLQFTCDICNKSFMCKWFLNHHERTKLHIQNDSNSLKPNVFFKNISMKHKCSGSINECNDFPKFLVNLLNDVNYILKTLDYPFWATFQDKEGQVLGSNEISNPYKRVKIEKELTECSQCDNEYELTPLYTHEYCKQCKKEDENSE